MKYSLNSFQIIMKLARYEQFLRPSISDISSNS